MPNWQSRLAVSVTDETGDIDVTPISSFSPSFALSAEAIHSLEKTHIGVVYSPKSVTFTMTVTAIGDAAARLTSLAMSGKTFDILLQESDDGTDWSFKKIMLSDCVITSASPTSASVAGAPSATFSGFSLNASAEPRNGEQVTIP